MNEEMSFKDAEQFLWRQIDDGLVPDKEKEQAYRAALKALNKIQRIESEFAYLSKE